MREWALLALAVLAGGCTVITNPDRFSVGTDGGADAATGVDSGPQDAGPTFDTGTPDAGSTDAGSTDAGLEDAGAPDAGLPDAGATDAGPPVIGDVDPYQSCAPEGRRVAPTGGAGSCAAPLIFDLSSAATGEIFEYEVTEAFTASSLPCLSDTERAVTFRAHVPPDHFLEISADAGGASRMRLIEVISASEVCPGVGVRCRGSTGMGCRAIVVQSSPDAMPTSDLVRFIVAEAGPPTGEPITLRMHIVREQDCSAGDPMFCEEFGG